MPWRTTSKQEQRFHLITQWRVGNVSVEQLCRRFRISRQTAYKWRRRFWVGRLEGLKDRSRRPLRISGRTSKLWLARLRRRRRQRPTWGARKLHYGLREDFGRTGLPSVATMSRWLKRWGLAVGRRRRPRGPLIIRPPVRTARHCNDLWTVDFKGCYKTGDGTRVDALTVRDLHSRYGLWVGLLRGTGLAATRREFVKIFRKYGLPKRMRSDNGTPFGGVGPTGLTRLSAWWVKLGIEVEFTTPGRPCENGAHEQFHRVYKAEVARQPALRRVGQQRRSTRWLRHYNEERPHEALGMLVPAKIYRKSTRSLPEKPRPWNYPRDWVKRWVKGNGEITWQGKRRFIGEAFVRDYVGLKPLGKNVWRVHFGPLVVGDLHAQETGQIRTAQYRRQK
jgi:transposase InsO family protein